MQLLLYSFPVVINWVLENFGLLSSIEHECQGQDLTLAFDSQIQFFPHIQQIIVNLTYYYYISFSFINFSLLPHWAQTIFSYGSNSLKKKQWNLSF